MSVETPPQDPTAKLRSFLDEDDVRVQGIIEPLRARYVTTERDDLVLANLKRLHRNACKRRYPPQPLIPTLVGRKQLGHGTRGRPRHFSPALGLDVGDPVVELSAPCIVMYDVAMRPPPGGLFRRDAAVPLRLWRLTRSFCRDSRSRANRFAAASVRPKGTVRRRRNRTTRQSPALGRSTVPQPR